MIDVNVDVGPMMEATGVIEGIARTMDTDIYINYVVNDATGELKDKFEHDFLAAAISNPRSYHHMFEWGSIGYHGILQESPVSTPYPLYALTRRGRGRFKEVGFRFKQSRIYVPLPDAARSGIPQENIDKLKRRHVFRFKAYVMESGMSVHVRPRGAKALFVPTPEAENNFAFSQGITVQPGKGNAGKFTSFWSAWWDSIGPAYLDETVTPRIEKQIKAVADEGLRTIRRGKHVKTKMFAITSMAALEAMAMEKAKMAENQLIRLQKAQTMDDEDWDVEE